MTQATESKQTSAEDQQLIDRFLRDNISFLGPDPAIMLDHHISPRSAREEEILAKPIDRQAFRDLRTTLSAALDETFEIAEQTAASPAAKCADLATGVFTASGELSQVSSKGVPGFVSTLAFPIKFILKYFQDDPTVEIREGDAFLHNDSRYGGFHSPDVSMFMPVFTEGELVAWVACAFHQGEIGARDPGGMGPMIESVWDEGLKCPPFRIVENYELKRDLVTLLQNSCREPQVFYPDLKVRLNSCKRLTQRVQESVKTNGLECVLGFLRQNIEDVDTEIGRRLSDIPPVTVRTSFFMDSTMREDALLRLATAITFKDGKVIVDLRGSSPEIANRPINGLVSACISGSMMGLSIFTWPDLPPSQVLLNRFEFITDDRSICSCSNDVPIALCMQVAFKLISAIEIAFSKATYCLPRRYANIKAAWFNQPSTLIYGGITQHKDMVGNLCGDLNGMPGGAKCNGDGEHSIAPNFASMTDIGECEHAEATLPVQYLLAKVMGSDNCGFGKYRGGSGYQWGMMRYGQQPFGFQTIAGGSSFPTTFGLFGGYGSPVYPTAKIKGVNLYEQLKATPEKFTASMTTLLNERPFEGATYETCPSSWPFEFALEGELYMISGGAGGGYGDVLDREPEAVIKDVDESVISAATARDIYKIVFNEETLALDVEATEQARQAEYAARIARGVDWDSYQAKHVVDTPDALPVPYFGAWNENKGLIYAGAISGAPGTLPPIYMPDPKDVKIAKLEAELAALAKD